MTEERKAAERLLHEVRLHRGTEDGQLGNNDGFAVDIELVANFALSTAQPVAPERTGLEAAQVKHMVERFLCWRLPENFNPDGGIEFKKRTPWPDTHHPVGTNLLDATQAEEMVRYMVEGLPRAAEVGQAK